MKKCLTIAIIFILLAKYGYNQNVVKWANHFSQLSGQGNGAVYVEITYDSEMNIYAVGSHAGIKSLRNETDTIIKDITSAGDNDIFIAKFDSLGSLKWFKNLGSIKREIARGISYNPVNNTIYINGSTENTIDFDPGLGTYYVTVPATSRYVKSFVLNLDTAGNFIGVNHIGGENTDRTYITDVSIDALGNLFYTGFFSDKVDFDFNPNSVFELTPAFGDESGFILKLNKHGDFEWVIQTSPVFIVDVKFDQRNNLIVQGYFSAHSIIDSVLFPSLPSPVYQESFICKLDTLGNSIWGIKFDKDLIINRNQLTQDSEGNLFFGNSFQGSITFNTRSGIKTLMTNSNNSSVKDYFISKIDTLGNIVWAKQYGGKNDQRLNSLIVNQHNDLIAVGTFNDTTTFFPNFDDLLFVAKGDHDMFIANHNKEGEIINVSTLGCRSSTFFASSVQNFGSNSIHVTGYSEGCYGNSDRVDSLFHRSFGEFNTGFNTVYEQAAIDCSSLDITLTKDNNTLIVNDTLESSKYQWISCTTADSIIPGEHSKRFTPAENGTYACKIYNKNCLVISECRTVINVGIVEQVHNRSILIFPNPVIDELTIEFNDNRNSIIEIRDANGKLHYQKNNSNTSIKISSSNLASGIYFVHVIKDDYKSVGKFFKL